MSIPTLENGFNGFPPTDKTGDVDESLVEYLHEMTPAERLTRCQQFANGMLTIWRSRGLEQWSNFANS
jgi:hypothetical protein